VHRSIAMSLFDPKWILIFELEKRLIFNAPLDTCRDA
jgi:hypothetical protein